MKKPVATLLMTVTLLAAAPAQAATETQDAWADFGMGVAAVAVNSVYIPAKILYATFGGLVGAIALGVTGGNMNAADGVWGPALGGDYVVTSEMLAGKEPLHFVGSKRAAQPDDF